jgi:aspartyl-tRNA(Asn)/glutamyl-tRNA(Gln) amidotransferase subunit A
MALSWSMDKLGPLCRTADDAGLVLAAIAGHDPEDPSSIAGSWAWTPARPRGRRWRIGVLKDAATGAQEHVRANFEAALAVVGDYAEIVPDIEFPDLPFGNAASTLIDAEGAAAFEDMLVDGRAAQLAAPEDRTGGYSGMVVLASDYIKALRLRRPLGKALDDLLKQVDALVHPTRATPAYPLDKPFREAWPGVRGGPGLSGAENLCGTPAVGIPNGFADDNLPTSVQFSARAFDEAVVLTLAREYQARTDWHTRRPDVS